MIFLILVSFNFFFTLFKIGFKRIIGVSLRVFLFMRFLKIDSKLRSSFKISQMILILIRSWFNDFLNILILGDIFYLNLFIFPIFLHSKGWRGLNGVSLLYRIFEFLRPLEIYWIFFILFFMEQFRSIIAFF